MGTFILVSNEIRELEFEKGEKEEMEMLKTFSRSVILKSSWEQIHSHFPSTLCVCDIYVGS